MSWAIVRKLAGSISAEQQQDVILAVAEGIVRKIVIDLTSCQFSRDARRMMIVLDPESAETTPAILKQVAQAHEGMTDVYGAVLLEGTIRKGDPVELL